MSARDGSPLAKINSVAVKGDNGLSRQPVTTTAGNAGMRLSVPECNSVTGPKPAVYRVLRKPTGCTADHRQVIEVAISTVLSDQWSGPGLNRRHTDFQKCINLLKLAVFSTILQNRTLTNPCETPSAVVATTAEYQPNRRRELQQVSHSCDVLLQSYCNLVYWCSEWLQGVNANARRIVVDVVSLQQLG